MIEIRQTEAFGRWLDRLRDRQVRARIQVRLDRLAIGLFGDVKPVGSGVNSASITVQVTASISSRRVPELVILLAGGDKRTQERDIKRALMLARDV